MNQLFSLKKCFISSDLFYKKKNLYVAKYLKYWFIETLYKNNQMIKEFKQKKLITSYFPYSNKKNLF
jgi:CRISPR/Cas system CSM-associated protein Csm4 (group 5 of RAMP superfamily)